MILAADTYATNADLICAVRDLGYINDGSHGLDVTYGKGTWWKKWAPRSLAGRDIAIDGTDFRRLPYVDNAFDFVAFDPPYVAVGGRKTSTIGGFNDAYGLVDVPKTPYELHDMMVDGLLEAHRVLKPKGLVLFKCMNYVTSGKYHPQAYDALRAVTPEFFRLKDQLIHLRKPGPQPKREGRQMHARANYSFLFVLEAIK